MNIYLYSNDLRTHDHPLLYEAQQCGYVIGLYVINPMWVNPTEYGFMKKSNQYMTFLYDHLTSLEHDLKNYNIPLIITKGDIEESIQEISKHVTIEKIYTLNQLGEEEAKRIDRLSALNIPIITQSYHSLYSQHTLPFSIKFAPDIFTHYKNVVENTFYHTYKVQSIHKQAYMLEIPIKNETLVSLGISSSGYHVKSGEEAALKHLHDYFFIDRYADTYKTTRNDMLEWSASTKFSLYLGLGIISPFQIMNTLIEYERTIHKNESTYWIYFELLWRDYFHLMHEKYGNKIFSKDGILGHAEVKHNNHWIQAWMNGNTGFPLIDANMRLLNQTGYMSNRGRQVVANFFTKVLKQDYRIGAAYFESKLLDYDVSSNYLNWLYVSGLGNDPRENRLFNVIIQGERYDESRQFVYTLLPELKHVPKSMVYKLHTLDEKTRASFHILDYPKPIVRL